MTLDVLQAQTSLAALVDQAVAGEEVIFAKAGKPVAKLVAVESPAVEQPRRRLGGALRGKIILHPGWDEPDEETIRAMYEGPIFPDEKP